MVHGDTEKEAGQETPEEEGHEVAPSPTTVTPASVTPADFEAIQEGIQQRTAQANRENAVRYALTILRPQSPAPTAYRAALEGLREACAEALTTLSD